ncbi:MAG: hypothetical protein U0946_05610 [Patescibacteria group bacterium]|nr:hypothetical protein [Patescibacteria group bacterium]
MSTLNELKHTWQHLPKKQKIALFVLFLFLIILPLTLASALNEVRTRSKATNEPQFPINPLLKIANQSQSWTIQFTGNNPSAMNTQLQVKARNCQLYDINDCTAPVTIAPWNNLNNTPKMMTSGVLQNTLPSSMPLGKIYFAKVKPYNSSFANLYSDSNEYGIGVSSIPSAVHTDVQIRQKYVQAVNAYINSYPVNNAQGIAVGGHSTIGSVESSNKNSDEKADFSGRVICGNTKIHLYQSNFTLNEFNAWQEDFAKWRGCMTIASHLNNIYTIWQYVTNNITQTAAKEKITRNTFMLLANMETLLTNKGQTLFTGFTNPNVKYLDNTPNANYTLGNTYFAKEYITDFGMGVLKSIGWAKQLDIINNQYCSYYMGANGGCANVNIQQMVRSVTQRLYDKEKAEFDANDSWKYDHRRSRHLAGMAMAAKLNGQQLDRETYFINLASEAIAPNLNGMDIHSFIHPAARITSDFYQHHETLFTIKNWQPVTQISAYMNNNNAHTLLKQYYNTFFINNQPIFDFTKDSYNLNILQTNGQDNSQIGNCNESNKFWHRTNNNKVVGLRGESPSSALLTSIPALLHISEVVNPYANADLKNTLYTTLQALQNNPSNYDEENCAGGVALGTVPFTRLSVTLRQLAFQIHGYLFYTKTPIASF